MLEVLSVQAMAGSITKRSDAYRLFKVDTQKIDRIYDMAMKKGLVKLDEAPVAWYIKRICCASQKELILGTYA